MTVEELVTLQNLNAIIEKLKGSGFAGGIVGGWQQQGAELVRDELLDILAALDAEEETSGAQGKKSTQPHQHSWVGAIWCCNVCGPCDIEPCGLGNCAPAAPELPTGIARPEGFRNFGEFHDEGLLWLINTSVFHPRGYAIAFIYEDDDTEFKNAIGWILVGDGREPLWYNDAPTSSDSIDAQFAKVQKLLAAPATACDHKAPDGCGWEEMDAYFDEVGRQWDRESPKFCPDCGTPLDSKGAR